MFRYQYMHIVLMKKVDKIIAVSDYMRRLMMREGIPEEKISLIYPALDDPEVHVEQRISSMPLKVGYIGAVSPHKGVHVLMDAFRDLDDTKAQLHIYGTLDTLYQSSLRALDASNIFFHGAYNSEDLTAIFSSLDVVVLPSVCPDNSPLVVQEALRHGIPVIGSLIGGIPEYIQDDFGALFEAGNSRELKEILVQLTNEPAILQRWKRNIPKLGTVDSLAREIYGIYESLMPSDKKPLVNPDHIRLLGSHDRGYLRNPFIPYQLIGIYRLFRSIGVERIAIFGSGALGRKVAEHIRYNGFRPAAFLDNDAKKHGQVLDGVRIISPDLLQTSAGIDFEAIFIVSDWEADILEQLRKMNLLMPIIGLYSYEPQNGDGREPGK